MYDPHVSPTDPMVDKRYWTRVERLANLFFCKFNIEYVEPVDLMADLHISYIYEDEQETCKIINHFSLLNAQFIKWHSSAF